jgi:hypothetical protein
LKIVTPRESLFVNALLLFNDLVGVSQSVVPGDAKRSDLSDDGFVSFLFLANCDSELGRWIITSCFDNNRRLNEAKTFIVGELGAQVLNDISYKGQKESVESLGLVFLMHFEGHLNDFYAANLSLVQ